MEHTETHPVHKLNKQNIGRYMYWHPWRGCNRVTEACENCYVKHGFIDAYQPFPHFSATPGTVIDVCLYSDFFLEDADHLRQRAWNEIKHYGQYIFLIITKRAERIKQCLPDDWNDGYENVIICITAETQQRADERLPILTDMPCKHRWVACCPTLEEVDITKYLSTGKIEAVESLGEKGFCGTTPRVTKYDWVKSLYEQCAKYDVRFNLLWVGHNFEMPDGTILTDHTRCYCSDVAESLGLTYFKQIEFNLTTHKQVY